MSRWGVMLVALWVGVLSEYAGAGDSRVGPSHAPSLEAQKTGAAQKDPVEIQRLRQEAEQGDVVAQNALGFLYYQGQGVPQDYAEAVKWYRRAANQGHAEAQVYLGTIYYNGHGVPQDYAEVAKWWRRAADQGLAAAQFVLGSLYWNGEGVPQDVTEAVKWWRQAADQGLAVAQWRLGFIYLSGQGVVEDLTEAVKWHRRAADQGLAVAQFGLGMMYWVGLGVPQHYAEAAKWFRRAADQGRADAQSVLGSMYEQGQGVPQDVVQAHAWLNLAVTRMPSGSVAWDVAVRGRASVEQRMTPAQLARAQEIARTWQPQVESVKTPVVPSPAATALPPLVRSTSPRRDVVRQVQERLQAVGFNPGAIDGAMGPQTRDALRRFQNTKGLRPTGEPDEATLDTLGVR